MTWNDYCKNHPERAILNESTVLGVEWDARDDRATVVIQGSRPWPASLVAEVTDFLSNALAARVEVRVQSRDTTDTGAVAPDWVHVLTSLNGAFKRLLAADGIRHNDDGSLSLTLNGPGSMPVFESWGGVERLRREVPGLPRVHILVAEALPAPFEEPVEVPQKRLPVRFGRGLPQAEPVPLSEVGDEGDAVVEGRIFWLDRRSVRDGAELLLLGITDGVSQLRLKLLERRGQPWPGSELAVGVYIRAAGRLERDRSGEVVLRIRNLGTIAPPALDDGSDVPRVEWHCHTKMSAMDAVVDLEDVMGLAARLGHTAIGIVDHGVVQAYPEAASLAARHGLRVLYGLEAYVVEDQVRALTGPVPDGPWSEWPLVAVDLETTGLSPRVHDIVEIGAVRIEHGQVIERFESLIRPKRHALTDVSSRITGLQSHDLENAPDAKDVLAAFAKFAQGAVLIAHNAAFDLGFLRPHLPCVPAVLDTLTLARVLLPDQKSLGLAPLCERFKIPMTQHHRAQSDAAACGALFLAMMNTEAGQALGRTGLGQPSSIPPHAARPFPVLIYPRNEAGRIALYQTVTRSHLEFFHRVPRIPWPIIQQHRSTWLIGAPALGGELVESLFRGASNEEWQEAEQRYDFWEVVPPSALHHWWGDGELSSQAACEELVTELVHRADIARKPVIAVSDVHYVHPEDHVLRDILKTTAKSDLHAPSARLHFRTTGEMLDEMAFLGEDRARRVVITEPRRLMEDAIAVDLQPVPDGLYAPHLPEAEQVVSSLPWERARRDFGDPLPPLVKARLSREIDAIVQHGFASVYYTAHRLVQKSLLDGYLVGSRGSVGSSLVATYLDITEVNPLPPHYRCPSCQYSQFFTDGRVGSGFDLPDQACPRCGSPLMGDGQDIPFETFLGFSGDKVPDIDLNFSGEYQPQIHRYAEDLFGHGQVFRAGTIATVADRTAFGLVKAWARERNRELRPIEIEYLVRGLVGVKRTTGQHPGGLMVVPLDEDIHRFTPVQRPADAPDSDIITTHFDYHAIEGRLLKLDLLGHEDPTTLKFLGDLTGVDVRRIPFQDEPTLALFSSLQPLGLSPEQMGSPIGTLALPEFGTPFVRRMLAETRPKTFAELVRISGLSHGTNVWVSNAEELIRNGRATLAEVIATRDDIMTYLIRQGLDPHDAFNIMEQVRRGRGLSDSQAALMKAHDVPEWYLESCRRITYMFPKAHAVAYVTMCWRIAWFKVHYPLAFYAAYCTVHADDFLPEPALGGLATLNAAMTRLESLGNEASAKEKSQLSLLEVLREMLLRGWDFTPVSLMQSDPERFLPIDNQHLLMPFVALPGLGRSAAQNIVDARARGPFLSVDDLRERARLTKTVLDLLRQYGALDDLGETRQLAFF